MATLIPDLEDDATAADAAALHFARHLQALPDNDCLCWRQASIGAGHRHPDFILLYPSRGLLVLEVADWTAEQLLNVTALHVQLATDGTMRRLPNPVHQAHVYARAIMRVLEKERRSSLSCGHGAVLMNISRRELQQAGFADNLSTRILCKDDLSLDPQALQQRLWSLAPSHASHSLSSEQIAHLRHTLFPASRIKQAGRTERLTLDMQQEGVARLIGNGHRVVHGVAGSGKTLLLVQKSRELAHSCDRPVLVLCISTALAGRLEEQIGDLQGRIIVRDFQGWCLDQLRQHHIDLPGNGDGFQGRLTRALSQALATGKIPKYQYGAVLIDEGHDFEPEWLRIVTQMPEPQANALLLLLDGTQAIHGKKHSREFSLARAGIQARGRTAVLRVNYRSSTEILTRAQAFAEALQSEDEISEHALPTAVAVSAGRNGPAPQLRMFDSLAAEVSHIASELRSLHRQGQAWRDMAVLYPARFIGEEVARQFRDLGLPLDWLQAAGQRLDHRRDSIKAMTLHTSKGLEFGVVAIAGIGFMPYREDEAMEDARLLYVGMTRAAEHLLLTAHRPSEFAQRLMSLSTEPPGRLQQRFG